MRLHAQQAAGGGIASPADDAARGATAAGADEFGFDPNRAAARPSASSEQRDAAMPHFRSTCMHTAPPAAVVKMGGPREGISQVRVKGPLITAAFGVETLYSGSNTSEASSSFAATTAEGPGSDRQAGTDAGRKFPAAKRPRLSPPVANPAAAPAVAGQQLSPPSGQAAASDSVTGATVGQTPGGFPPGAGFPPGVGQPTCHCGQPATFRVSRAQANPNRPYTCCALSSRGGCKYFAWLDEAALPTDSSLPSRQAAAGSAPTVPPGVLAPGAAVAQPSQAVCWTPGGSAPPVPPGVGQSACHCGQLAAEKVSQSERNPNRAYLACVRGMHGGCGYFEWSDEAALPDAITRDVIISCTTQRLEVATIAQAEHDGTLALLRAVEWSKVQNKSRVNVIPDGEEFCLSFILGRSNECSGWTPNVDSCSINGSWRPRFEQVRTCAPGRRSQR